MPTKKKTRVTSPRMKAYLEAKKHETVLLGEVDRYLQMLPNDRDATVIHPSEMCKPDWCPRATWHRLVGHPMKEGPVVPLRLNLIFETGTESGEKWQRWTQNMGILWGRWKCVLCWEEKRAWSNELGGDTCPTRNDHGPHMWKYKEVPLTHGRIGGHADGIVNPSGDENILMENKTIGPGTLRLLNVLGEEEADEVAHDKFGRITKILPSHFRQTQIYLRMSQALFSEIGPVLRAVVVYEYKSDQQVREFVVEYDPRWTDHLWEVADDIDWAISKDREVKCPYGGCAQCRAYEEAK
jgi:hypothetical protein